MSAFTDPTSIGNRALQHCGAKRITAFTDDSKNAAAIAFVYDKARRAELRRNVWRFAIRRGILRRVTDTSLEFVPATWGSTKTYTRGSIVSASGVVYMARRAVPVNKTPGTEPTYWSQYFGTDVVQLWTAGSYSAGDLVYTPASSSAAIYLSMVDGNEDDPTAAPPAWSATTLYKRGDTVTYSAVVYQAAAGGATEAVDLNLNQNPSSTDNWETIPVTQTEGQMRGQKWLRLDTATMAAIVFAYPISQGASRLGNLRSVYQLPHGFLREAPLDPKAGVGGSWLGAPSGPRNRDWVIEGNFIVSGETGPLPMRFVADIADVPMMDDMFCEGLGARIALEVCEDLTQSAEKLQSIGAAYARFMTEARIVNSIEVGSTEPPEDDFITCRV